MKSKIIALLLLTLPLLSFGQERMLSTFPSGKDITKVFVGGGMLSSAADMIDGVTYQFAETLSDIKAIEVYECENKEMYATVSKEFDKLLQKLNTEVVMYSEEDDGEISQIHTVTHKNEKEPTAMIIYNSDKALGEINIVIIHGAINTKAFTNIKD